MKEGEEKLFFTKIMPTNICGKNDRGKNHDSVNPPPHLIGSGKDYEQMVKSLGNRIFTG